MLTAAIKTATRTAIKACGGLDSISRAVRVGITQLSDYCNREKASVVPVDVAVELDKEAQEPLILSVMAQAEGFALVPVKFGNGLLPHDMGKFAKATSEVLQKGFESMADGNVDVQEAHEILTYAQRARTSLHHIEATAHKIIAEGKPLQVSVADGTSAS